MREMLAEQTDMDAQRVIRNYMYSQMELRDKLEEEIYGRY